MSRRRRKYKHPAPLIAENYPKSVRWKVDVDYLEALENDPEAKQWLAQFLSGHYNGWFIDDPDGPQWTPELKRQIYREKNYARNESPDPSTLARATGATTGVVHDWPGEYDPDLVIDEDDERSWSSPPAYLESAEYKAALIDLRQAIDRRKEPDGEANYRVARRRLEQIVREHEEPEE